MRLYAMRNVRDCFASGFDVLIGIDAMRLLVVAVAQRVGGENTESGCECDETM